ncbi:B-cell receptor CD22-like [Salvelinus sp. IW2-2015]|uniref:B-cell receptor CD22-like n=1 Tax=Salvelinus sp. IW2-2015 TaxID=2691554 RepID=UPI0038D493C3
MALRTAGSVLVVFLWSVTDLQVKVTTTWWSTTLTCSTTCTLTGNPTYIWYRNSKIVQEDSSPSYSVDLKTEDSFYCAVKGINSPAVYGPKNTSVSVSPSGEIVEGSSVNLTCSSDANPPVDKYTWYKITYKKMSMKHSGQRYTIHNISSEEREGYYCEALNIIGREHIPVHINVTYTAAVLPWVPVVGVGAVLTVGALLLTIYCYMKRYCSSVTLVPVVGVGAVLTVGALLLTIYCYMKRYVRDSPVTQPLR